MRTIVANEIESIHCFELVLKASSGKFDPMKSRPAFRIGFKDGGALVVKFEISRANARLKEIIKLDAKLMKKVSQHVDAKILSEKEHSALMTQGPNLFDQGAPAQEYLLELLKDGMPCFKMAYVPKLRSLQSVIAKGGDKRLKMIAKLKERSNMHALGKIVAVDMFIGNEDRFNKDGNVVNEGNLLFTKLEDKSWVPVGLDFVTMSVESSDLFEPPQSTWCGLVLRDVETMGKLATSIVNNLNALLRLDGTPDEDLLGEEEVKKMIVGMDDGCNTIKEFLDDFLAPAAAPVKKGGAKETMKAAIKKKPKYKPSEEEKLLAALRAGVGERAKMLGWRK